MIKKPSQQDFVKTALRLPPELHSALHTAAIEQDRTYNAEIVNRLRSTFKANRLSKPHRKESSEQPRQDQ